VTVGPVDDLVITALEDALDALCEVTDDMAGPWTSDDADGLPGHRALPGQGS